MPVIASMATAALALTLHAVPVAEEEPTTVWDHLADCESGHWDRDAEPIDASRRWDLREGTFEGGLQFHPRTWDWLKPEHFPEAAYAATKEQQIAVGRRVLEEQGWKAWPVCSKKLGLR